MPSAMSLKICKNKVILLYIKGSLADYDQLIQLRIASATLINPPYESVDAATQTAIVASSGDIIIASAMARTFSLSAKIILSKLKLCNSAGASNIPFLEQVEHLLKANDFLCSARKEILRGDQDLLYEPRQEISNRFLSAAEFYRQAVEAICSADDPNRIRRSFYLHDAGNYFYRAAQEAQSQNPNQTRINNFLQNAQRCENKAASLPGAVFVN
jgi:hypothetical protein